MYINQLVRNIKLLLGLLVITFSTQLQAATIFVGPNEGFTSPNELYNAGILQDGDSILIQPGIYSGDDALAVWMADDLFISSVNQDPLSVKLVADGKYIWGKGIWVCAGNRITVQNIEFSGAQVPDHNGAGIRLDGAGLTIQNCYFHHCEMGILTNNAGGKVQIENTEFAYNGFGDGFSHNVYVNHADTLIFRYNYSHHSVIGHTLKSRADFNFIEFNRFADGPDGNSSRLIDLPNGGTSIIIGNELLQGPYAENSNFLGYGLEGLTNESAHELYVVHNTFANYKLSNGLFLHIQEGTTRADIQNNAFIGIGELVNGEITSDLGNFISVNQAEGGFVDWDNYNLNISEVSPLIDLGTELGFTTTSYPLTPINKYVHPLQNSLRVDDNKLDVGAQNFESPSYVFISGTDKIIVHPNPAYESIQINILGKRSASLPFDIYNAMGQIVKSGKTVHQIDISSLSSGIFYIKVGETTTTFMKL